MIQIETWHLITFLCGLLLAFLGCVGGFGRVMLTQFNRGLDQRFLDQEKLRVEARTAQARASEAAQAEINARLRGIEDGLRNQERDLLGLKADLPLSYVRREDEIRNQTVISAKLDALNARIETISERLPRAS